MNTPPLIQPEPPDKNLEEARLFWRETGRGLIRDSILAIDETARQIITVSGILEGLYFHSITFSDIRKELTNFDLFIYILPLALLLLSLATALLVFFPESNRINILSSDGSKKIYEDIVKSKLMTMRVSSIFLVLGIGSIVAAMIKYLV